MTLMRYERFAFFPKRCDCCNRLFWFESYDTFSREIGIEYRFIEYIRCKECIKEKQK